MMVNGILLRMSIRVVILRGFLIWCGAGLLIEFVGI